MYCAGLWKSVLKETKHASLISSSLLEGRCDGWIFSSHLRPCSYGVKPSEGQTKSRKESGFQKTGESWFKSRTVHEREIKNCYCVNSGHSDTCCYVITKLDEYLLITMRSNTAEVERSASKLLYVVLKPSSASCQPCDLR